VEVRSKTGSITIPIELTARIMRGVISIPHGYGHEKEGVQLSVASQPAIAGVSINDITDQERIDPVTCNAAFSGQIVQIIKQNIESSRT